MPKIDFLGPDVKPAFKKKVHRPWNSKLLETGPINYENVSQLIPESQSVGTQLNQLYSSHISIGGFLRLPPRGKDDPFFDAFSTQINLPRSSSNETQPWHELEAERLKNDNLISDKAELEQRIEDLTSDLTLKQSEFIAEISGLQAQIKILTSEKDAFEADYQNAVQYLQAERNEREQIQNQLLHETEALEAETAKRIQAEHNESLSSQAMANLEADRILIEKNKKTLEADTEAFIEKRSKMEAINENEQKLRKLYEEKMKALHENLFQLERQLKVEIEQKHHLEQKIAQFFENMKNVEVEKKELENLNFILEQEIKLHKNHVLELEAKLKDEKKVRKAFESTFSDALSKN